MATADAMATGDHYVLRYAGALNRSRAQRVIYTAQALLRLDVLLLVCYRPLARTTHVITRGGSGTPARHAGSILGLVNILFCFEVILRPHHGEEIAATKDKKGPETTGRASGGASVGAAERNMIFRNRGSGFAAGAARRDTAMRRARPRTGPSTRPRA